MPKVFEYKCDSCDFSLPTGWGGHMYVKDENGKKIVCPHPVEHYTIAETLKIDREAVFNWMMKLQNQISPEMKKLLDERTGFDSDCLCTKCLHQFTMDVEREQIECPQCGSKEVKTRSEMLQAPCPKCRKGKVVAIDTGAIS